MKNLYKFSNLVILNSKFTENILKEKFYVKQRVFIHHQLIR